MYIYIISLNYIQTKCAFSSVIPAKEKCLAGKFNFTKQRERFRSVNNLCRLLNCNQPCKTEHDNIITIADLQCLCSINTIRQEHNTKKHMTNTENMWLIQSG